CRAARPLFHDGRQSRRFRRQPRARRGRLRAVREFHRPRRDHLFLDRRGRACLGGLALAHGDAVGPPFHASQMSRSPKTRSAKLPKPGHSPDAEPPPPAAAEPQARPVEEVKKPKPAKDAGDGKDPKRRRRNTAEFEKRIEYRFKDAALLEQALTHIS